MIRRFLLGLAALVTVQLGAAPAVPLTNLVDEHTAFVVSITDAPALVRGWDASPMAKTWDDPQVARFFAPLREKIKLDDWDAKTKDATGSTLRELLALADGEALVAVPAMDFQKLKQSDAPPFLLAIHVGDHAAKLEKILADAATKSEVHEQTEVFSGATVHITPIKKASADAPDTADAKTGPDTFAWALVDGVWLLSAEKERVFAAIDALKNGGVEAALGKSVPFLAARERIGDDQALFYLNVAAIYPIVRDAVAAKKGAPNPLGVDPTVLLTGLGLDVLGEVYGAIRIGEKDTRMDFGLTYTEERGLVKLLAYKAGPVAQPDWVPAKWPSVSTMRFSASQAYAGLEEMLDAISPMLSGMAQGQITALNRKLGIDLKRDLIGSLGDDIITGYALPAGLDAGATPSMEQMDQLFAISLSNVDAFTQAVEALKQMIGGPAAAQLFAKRDYLGQTIYTFNAHPAPGAKPSPGFSYAIANRTVLLGIGSPVILENALQGMRDGQGAFWKRDDIKAALATIPPEASSAQFTDMRVVVTSLFELVATTQAAAASKGKGDDDDKKSLFDLSAKPDPEVIGRYWGLATGYTFKTPTGFFGTSRLLYPQP